VNYTVSMNDIQMAQGGREGVRVGTGNSTLGLETQLRNEEIPPWWVSHVRNGERTTLDIDATATSGRLGRSVDFSRSREIQTDLLGAFNSDETRPVNADSPLTSDPVLYVNETRGEWGRQRVGDADRDGVYGVQPEHHRALRGDGDRLRHHDERGGDGVGQTDEGYSIPSYSTETVEFTTALQNRHLDDWWVTHLDEEVRGHQVTGLRIEFYAVIEFPTGEEATIPLDALTYEETIETEIFDEGNDGETPASRRRTGQTTAVTEDDGGETSDGTTNGGNTTDGGNETDDGNTTENGTDDGTENGTDDGDDGVLPL